MWTHNLDHMWWEGQQGGEARLGGVKHMATFMAYSKPTEYNIMDGATCKLCAKWKGAFHFPKPLCNSKGTFQLFHIFDKTFVNWEVG
jgi:hypothetical protein